MSPEEKAILAVKHRAPKRGVENPEFRVSFPIIPEGASHTVVIVTRLNNGIPYSVADVSSYYFNETEWWCLKIDEHPIPLEQPA